MNGRYKYFKVPAGRNTYFNYRIDKASGKIEIKSGYSNVWMLGYYKTEDELLKAGAVEINEPFTNY